MKNIFTAKNFKAQFWKKKKSSLKVKENIFSLHNFSPRRQFIFDLFFSFSLFPTRRRDILHERYFSYTWKGFLDSASRGFSWLAEIRMYFGILISDVVGEGVWVEMKKYMRQGSAYHSDRKREKKKRNCSWGIFFFHKLLHASHRNIEVKGIFLFAAVQNVFLMLLQCHSDIFFCQKSNHFETEL